MTSATACPACGGSEVEPIGRVGPVPVLCGSLWNTREEALATPMADLDLVVCDSCGHVWNASFDPSLMQYDAEYDNALDFSPTFREYAGDLVDHLVDTFDLHGKRIAEIGSGKGEFLRQLCVAGDNKGIGYDPTYVGPYRDGSVEFVREFFSPATTPGDVDFVCCRHVLEHVEDPYDFLLDVRAAVISEAVPMYFEVPNADFNFSESGPWDLIYPHVAYFSKASLEVLLERAGFKVLSLDTAFGTQFLSAEVVVTGEAADLVPPEPVGRGIRRHMEIRRQIASVAGWRGKLADLQARGAVALWGAGSKGVTFLSLVDPEGSIGMVVDANPRKTGRFLPGGGHAVVTPEALRGHELSYTVIMNPVYATEIQEKINSLGLAAELVIG